MDSSRPEPRIDLTKSLHHLSLHGFDISGVTQAVSSPLRSQCFTPVGTPSSEEYLLSTGHMNGSESESNGSSDRIYLVNNPRRVERTLSTESSCSSSSTWSEKCRSFNDSAEDATPVKPSPQESTLDMNEDSFYYEDELFPLKVSLFNQQESLRSTINTNESDAVEVTLDLSCIEGDEDRMNPSAKRINDIPDTQSSLPYPPMSPQTPVRLPFCGIPSWCDANSSLLCLDDSNTNAVLRNTHHPMGTIQEGWCHSDFPDEDKCTPQQQFAVVQSQIQNSLGMEGWCWQALYPPSPPPVLQPISPMEYNNNNYYYCEGGGDGSWTNKHPRRVFSLTARRSRLISLRRNLHPFDAPPPPPLQLRHALGKSQSFNQASLPPPTTVLHTNKPGFLKRRDNNYSKATTAAWEWGGLDCAAPQESPVAVRLVPDEGYDSDPEDYHKNDKENRSKHCGSGIHSHDQQCSATTVEEFLNERYTFILHSDKSVAVHAWIERGQQLQDRVILPKLYWKPIHEPTQLSSMDLLDVCRVLPVVELDRDKFPFCVQQRLVTVKNVMTTEPVVFEARSVADRDRWMTLFKLTVSTLAAKFLTRDPAALVMFFADTSIAGGPGDAPRFEPQKQEAWV